MKKKLIILVALYFLDLSFSVTGNKKINRGKQKSIWKKLPYKTIFASLIGSTILYGFYPYNKLNTIETLQSKNKIEKTKSKDNTNTDVTKFNHIISEDINKNYSDIINNDLQIKKFIFEGLLIGSTILAKKPISNAYKNIIKIKKSNNRELNLNILQKKRNLINNKSYDTTYNTEKLMIKLKEEQIPLINKEKFWLNTKSCQKQLLNKYFKEYETRY